MQKVTDSRYGRRYSPAIFESGRSEIKFLDWLERIDGTHIRLRSRHIDGTTPPGRDYLHQPAGNTNIVMWQETGGSVWAVEGAAADKIRLKSSSGDYLGLASDGTSVEAVHKGAGNPWTEWHIDLIDEDGPSPFIVSDVNWCLSNAANSTLPAQAQLTNPTSRLMCKAILAATFVAPEFAGLVFSGIQRDWAELASVLACNADPGNQINAVGLIMACQCHNEGEARQMPNQHITVIHTLRQHHGCDNQGLPIY
ncbi:MAG: hypothetical protein WB870_10320 [Gallionellaceae bacterium]